VPEHIGNAGNTAMALVERIMLSLITRNKPDIEPDGFSEGLELKHHEQTHGIKQTQPRGTFQRQYADRDSEPVPAAVTKVHSDSDIVQPAPAVSMPLATRPRKGKNEASQSKPLSAEGLAEREPGSVPQINAQEVADRVYRLMQHDLILEKELPNRGDKLW
jgi:hypothetical protein